ncbi:cobalt-precorrin 5A hydrolase [Blautia segnis]|mgnify:FL=1|uniref:Cobalt-precorrin 5A hydrolase n=1 Tax=Blautia segnis TaxID=2763030 RepID=A0A8I0AJ62_9FIRM|nr:cobalt-precorrin 5A hydrolase [Blautia segnis]MBC5651690.1 cobalt-precorrin 5A hydrolase [Blautia segnis]
MKISIICFTLTGQQTGEKLKKALEEQEHAVSLYTKSKYIPESIKESTKQWAGKQFESADGIIFIGATGIAVRSIAPYVASKKTDPAVLVTDECGKFVISLLSGHLGGANELALQAAEALHAVPIVTTATDLEGKFAVDVFAKKNNCHIFRMKEAKEVSAALLAGEKVGFYSEFPWEGELPDGLVNCCGLRDENWISENEPGTNVQNDNQIKSASDLFPKVGIAVTIHKNCTPFLSTTHVVPQAVALGMGCRKNKEAQAVEKAAFTCLEENQIYPQAVACLASIDIKKEEPGLLALAEKMGIPFETFSSEELLAVKGEFTASSFVSRTVGVDNVCERSAIKAAQDRICLNTGRIPERNQTKPGTRRGGEHCRLIQRKQAADGVTAALVLADWRIHFE